MTPPPRRLRQRIGLVLVLVLAAPPTRFVPADIGSARDDADIVANLGLRQVRLGGGAAARRRARRVHRTPDRGVAAHRPLPRRVLSNGTACGYETSSPATAALPAAAWSRSNAGPVDGGPTGTCLGTRFDGGSAFVPLSRGAPWAVIRRRPIRVAGPLARRATPPTSSEWNGPCVALSSHRVPAYAGAADGCGRGRPFRARFLPRTGSWMKPTHPTNAAHRPLCSNLVAIDTMGRARPSSTTPSIIDERRA